MGNAKRSAPGTLSRTVVKGIVTAAMVLNHFATVFLPEDSVLCALLLGIGYSTAVAMCFFLTEGFFLTRSRKRYGKRLLLFGVISEIPYLLAFLPQIKGLQGAPGNMILTLFLCFLILSVLSSTGGDMEKQVLIVLLFWLSCFTDWALLAPAFVVMFYFAGRDRKKLTTAFIAAAVVVAVSTGITEISKAWTAGFFIPRVFLFSLLSLTGPTLAGVLILRFYLNNETVSVSGSWDADSSLLKLHGSKTASADRGASEIPFFAADAASSPAPAGTEKARGTQSAGGVSKWFFYWFYPAHLLLLGILRIMLMSGR